MKEVSKHPLSRELQLYFANIVDGVVSDQDEIRERALTSVAEDPGLHQLAPHFTLFIADQVSPASFSHRDICDDSSGYGQFAETRAATAINEFHKEPACKQESVP